MTNPTRQEISDALKGGPHAWNEFRAEQGSEWTPNLDGMDLRNVNLFDEKTYTGANLQKASMVNVTADDTTILKAADMRGVIIKDSQISGMQAPMADMTGATIQNNVADGISLKAATLDDAKITGNTMQGSDLAQTHIWRSDVSDNNFDHSQIGALDAGHSTFDGNSFNGVSSQVPRHSNPFPIGTDEYDGFNKIYPSDDKIDAPASITNSTILNNSFDHADLKGLQTGNSHFAGNNSFQGTDLQDSWHNGTDLGATDLTQAHTDGSAFFGTDTTDLIISEQQWEDRYESSTDRLGRDNLEKDQRNDIREQNGFDDVDKPDLTSSIPEDTPSAPQPMQLS